MNKKGIYSDALFNKNAFILSDNKEYSCRMLQSVLPTDELAKDNSCLWLVNVSEKTASMTQFNDYDIRVFEEIFHCMSPVSEELIAEINGERKKANGLKDIQESCQFKGTKENDLKRGFFINGQKKREKLANIIDGFTLLLRMNTFSQQKNLVIYDDCGFFDLCCEVIAPRLEILSREARKHGASVIIMTNQFSLNLKNLFSFVV